MTFGYTGKILRINLSNGEIKIDKNDYFFYRKYMGGSCMASYYLLKEVEKNLDPFAEENLLIFSTSIVTGITCPGTAICSVVSKSPLTGMIGESISAGYFGEKIKSSGFDAIIIKGKSQNPVFLYIHDNKVEIISAVDLWGKTTNEAYDLILAKIKRTDISISLIGPAGEKKVRFASIISDLLFNFPRFGMGAVMGSKNLKAIAVIGGNKIKVSNPEKIYKLSESFKKHFTKNPANLLQYNGGGLGGLLGAISKDGLLSTMNFQKSLFKYNKDIDGGKIAKKYGYKNVNCSNCFNGCKRLLENIKNKGFEKRFGSPELETLCSIPYNLQFEDMDSALVAHELISKFGLDATSCGNVLGFAFECYEKGLISKKDTGGIELKWGNSSSALKLIEKITYRQDIGDVLAEGVKIASTKIKNSEELAMHVKGAEIPAHEPRAKQMVGFGYAIGVSGPSTFTVEHDTDFDNNAPQLFMDKVSPLCIYKRLSSQSLTDEKIRMFYLLQNAFSMMNALNVCIFAFSPIRFFDFKDLVEIINATTGWETSLYELIKLSERRIAMFKLFAMREGITSKEDSIPNRFFTPISDGPLKGVSIKENDFEKGKFLYYRLAGFSSNGNINKEKLLDLGISELEKYI